MLTFQIIGVCKIIFLLTCTSDCNTGVLSLSASNRKNLPTASTEYRDTVCHITTQRIRASTSTSASASTKYVLPIIFVFFWLCGFAIACCRRWHHHLLYIQYTETISYLLFSVLPVSVSGRLNSTLYRLLCYHNEPPTIYDCPFYTLDIIG